MPGISELWTIGKAARELKTSYGRIEAHVKSGRIPHVVLGSGQVLVTLQGVQDYLDNPVSRGRKTQTQG